jgi:hypothetical protein
MTEDEIALSLLMILMRSIEILSTIGFGMNFVKLLANY